MPWAKTSCRAKFRSLIERQQLATVNHNPNRNEKSLAMTTASITITEHAAERIAQIVCNEPETRIFRISVEGGGCSGFAYRFNLVPNAEPQDAVIEHAGAKILVDPLSLSLLTGSEIDFVDELTGASFKIKNPNATAACGCGTSFSV